MSKEAKRLFREFEPEHYALSFVPDAKLMKFSGTVSITGRKVGRPSQRLTLHQKGLKITSAEVVQVDKSGEQKVEVDRVNIHKTFDEVRIHTGKKLVPGNYKINLHFTGSITKVMQGIYPSFFKHKGAERVIIATQFESHHAREAFPCIDEPEAKATFQLTLTTPKGQTVLSNTRASKQTDKGQLTTTIFEKTPRMSTYLLAFVIGDLHNVSAKTKSGIEVCSWASIAQPQSHLRYANDEAVKILDFFTDYFGTNYPLKKLDQVALPDFDAGAMENWGLITYREIALLSDPVNRSISNEQYVTLVVAHELSHQWFGNLVTMKWWDDLWLNESFAGLMEHIAPDALHPDWQQWELYAASDILATTSRDIYKGIQPVGVKVTDPELIMTLFDPGIVYAKGGRLLKMLREYIGEAAFKKGLQAYFKQFAYKNATRDDLWQALSKASGQDISKLMTPWLVQPGMPVIHVAEKGKTLQLHQERFMLDAAPDDSLWPIPLLANQSLSPEVLVERRHDIKEKSKGLLILNRFGSGHYLVDYMDAGHQAQLVKAIQSGKLPTEARINLLNDQYLLARHGDISLTVGLDIIREMGQEPRDAAWSAGLRLIGAATQLTEGDKTAEEQLKHLKTGLGVYWYNKLGWDDQPKDDPNTKQLRHSAVSLMLGGEDKSAIAEALKRYHAAKLADISAELRGSILISAVKFGAKGVVTHLLKEYPGASPDVQLDITSALSATKDPEVGQSILKAALGPKGFVRPQDVMRWLALFLRNYYTRSAAWDFMLKQWGWIEETLQDSKSIDYLPTYSAAVISTPEWAKKYQKFFEPKLAVKILKHNIQLGMADIDARVAWRQRDEAKIKSWLAKY